MTSKTLRDDIAIARQMHRALVLHFIEGQTQGEIAKALGISHASVNRLIKRGRQTGLVEIKIKSPVEHLVAIEEQLRALGGISRAMVVPTVSDNPLTTLQSVGEAAGQLLVETIRDGDVLCISGGKGVSAIANGLKGQHGFNVQVVPATGLVQGKHYTDVNHVATELAERLGGHAFQIHAPLFADSAKERSMLMKMRAVDDVFRRGREANLAVVGIGSILADDSSYYDLHPTSGQDRKTIEQSGAAGELLAHLIDKNGQLAGYTLNDTLVSLTLPEFAEIPNKIGVASGPSKVIPILSVMRGNHLDTLVTDEATAIQVLEAAAVAA